MRPLAPLLLLCLALSPVPAAEKTGESREFLPPPFDAYFARRVADLSSAAWRQEITRENWPAHQTKMRAQLQRMLGLDPWPARGDLQPVVTGTVQGDGYVVEKLHFQSSPGLYVTANLYRPTEVTQPLPAILYLCGHSRIVENGVSMGNKTGYQHHGIWFARHGYVCLVLDTIQLGEIQGEHHGTYSKGRWWWVARGYTPAGVEAWNGIRALDYLETRPEVDRTRFGVTGRSGGGATSWWIAALDERVKVAAPTAGITTLKNHVLDGAVEGHCDCMFYVNTERWDFDRIAALVAPRPLLISNTDKDEIFPLDGVMEIYHRTGALYRTLGKEEHIGLQVAEGPHKDTQPLNTGAFHWFNRFLKGADRMDLTAEPARKMHAPAQLRVFEKLPADERVTTVDEWFVPAATAAAIETPRQREELLAALRRDCFRAWPSTEPNATATKTSDTTAEGLQLSVWEFTSEEPFRLTLWLLHRGDLRPEECDRVMLHPLDDEGWRAFSGGAAAAFPTHFPQAQPDRALFDEQRTTLLSSRDALAFFCPRGAGPTSFAHLSEKKRTHLLRRFHILGESLESGQTWDIIQAAGAVRSIVGLGKTPPSLRANRTMAANALYASLFDHPLEGLDLHQIPFSDRNAPIYPSNLRCLGLSQALAFATDHIAVLIDGKPAQRSTDAAPHRKAE
jgi:dienelactone hydrolase